MAAAIATVGSTFTLSGFDNVMQFVISPPGPAALAFIATLCAQLDITAAYVMLTGVSVVPSSATRRLLAGVALAVSVELFATTPDMQVVLEGDLTSISTEPDVFTAALNAELVATLPPPVPLLGVTASLPVTTVRAADALNNILRICSAGDSACADNSQQESFLSKTAQAAAFLPLSSGTVTLLADTVLTLVSSGTLSDTSQGLALGILGNIASAGSNVTADSAQTITNALSAVAGSALGSLNSDSVKNVVGVVDSLSSSMASSLLTNSTGEQAAVSTSSATIQTLVAVSPPGTAPSGTLSAPNSSSSFDPVPASALAGAAPDASVVTQFFSLAFDPNGGGGSTGVTRLAFTNDDGSAIAVEDQTTPITFTLPAVDGDAGGGSRRHLLAAAGEQGACTYWSVSTSAYAQQGCIGVPNPAPEGHNLSFTPGFQTPDDTSLLMAWEIEGPLVDGCCSFLLNCSDPALADVAIPLDPTQPLTQPVVRCSDVSAPNVVSGTRALRIFTGGACQLWQPDNEAGWCAPPWTLPANACERF
jgi:hypothetical protein